MLHACTEMAGASSVVSSYGKIGAGTGAQRSSVSLTTAVDAMLDGISSASELGAIELLGVQRNVENSFRSAADDLRRSASEALLGNKDNRTIVDLSLLDAPDFPSRILEARLADSPI
jgi:hypothetical protein